MSEEQEVSERVCDVELIVRLLRGQISQEFDSYRMRKRWPIILSKADPKDVAEALVLVLSHGQYVPREERPKATNITVHCNGADPVALAAALACVGPSAL